MKLTLSRTTVLALLMPAALSLTGCAGFFNSLVPDVYLVDRHTIMEADAAGEWPELDQRLRQDIDQGPQAFAGVDEKLDEQAAFRVLNDEYATPDQAAAEADQDKSDEAQ